MTPSRVFILLGAIVMFGAGIAHSLGYTFVVPLLLSSNLDPRIARAIQGVWLIYTAHLVLLAPAFILLSTRTGARPILLWLTLIPLVDLVLMYWFVGFFLGFYMLSLSAGLLLIGCWLAPEVKSA